MKVEIVSLNGPLLSTESNFVIVPGAEGEIGILNNHAMMLTKIIPGQITVDIGSKKYFYAVSNGFAEVSNNTVTIIADDAIAAAQINTDDALRNHEEAISRLNAAKESWEKEKASQELSVAKAWLKVAKNNSL